MKCEYKVIHIQAAEVFSRTGMPKQTGEVFDKLGAEGWELVEVQPILRGGVLVFGCGIGTYTQALVAFFRRERK